MLCFSLTSAQPNRNRRKGPLFRTIFGFEDFGAMEFARGRLLVALSLLLLMIGVGFGDAHKSIPTTLEGPFKPFTRELDPNMRLGSEDLPQYDPRVVKRAAAIFPEQISLALSTPDAMWVSWVTGMRSYQFSHSSKCFLAEVKSDIAEIAKVFFNSLNVIYGHKMCKRILNELGTGDCPVAAASLIFT